MADNFDMKKFLVENKLGAYSRMKNEGEAAYEYEKGKAAGEKIEKKKLAKEDMGHDIEDAEAEKMMDFLAEEPDQAKVQDLYDKITAVIAKAAKKLSDDDASALHDKLKAFFNKLFEGKKQVKEAFDVRKVQSADDKLRMLISNISTNSNIPTADKEGLLSALSELQDFVDEVGYDAEMEDDEPVSDYSRYRRSEVNENLSSNNVQTLSSDHIQLIQNIIDNYSDGGIYADPAMDRIERIINGDLSMEDPEDGGTFKYENVNEESVRMFKSDNPEGDKLVLGFLKRIAKDFDYPVAQAAMFVKERIKKLGY